MSAAPLGGSRQDIADMVRLVRFVKDRRAWLVTTGEPTDNADALLATLERGLRSAMPRRHSAAGRQSRRPPIS